VVRNATDGDTDRVVALAKRMHGESPVYEGIPFDEKRAAKHIRELHIVLIAEDAGELIGMMGGYITPPVFSNEFICYEAGLYVVPERRTGRTAVKLLQAFEARAMGYNVARIVVGTTTGVNAEGTLRFYERLGYKHTGYTLMKDMTWVTSP